MKSFLIICQAGKNSAKNFVLSSSPLDIVFELLEIGGHIAQPTIYAAGYA